ncbi:hypothetical protein KCU71_g1512, partial [Aureobasidium melanogenum]
MSEQQASAGASMLGEQVIDKHVAHQDTPATDQQAPDDATMRPTQTHDPTSARDNHAGDLLNDPVKTYTLMLEQFSKGNTKEGEKLAQELVLWGPYPEKVHARLFLAQGTQDALVHARLACKEAAKAIAKYGENDNEKFKLLDLTYRTLAQVKAEEGLGVIEEVEEGDEQVEGGAEANQEVKEKDDQEVKEKDDQRAKEKNGQEVDEGDSGQMI